MSNKQDRIEEKHKDLHNKMALARRIVKTCEIDGTGFKYFIKLITGERTVNSLIKDVGEERISKSFKDVAFEKIYWQMIFDDKVYFHRLESYEKTRNIIYDMYIKMRAVPTIQLIKEAINSNEQESNHTCEPKINCILNRNGFELKHLPGTNKAIIVEVADQANKRKEYLGKIKSYREMNKPILHLKCIKLPIGLGKFTIEDRHAMNNKFLMIAVLPVSGWLQNILLTQSCDLEEDFHRWLQMYVIPYLPESSVVVVEENQDLTENVERVPTAFSRKQDMIEWLEQYDIPHNPDEHRGELFLLIEKTKSKIRKNADKFVDIFEFYGHVVLRRPDVASLDYFKGLFEYVFENLMPQLRKGPPNVSVKDLLAVLRGLTEKQLKECCHKLSESEQRFYDEDMMLEEIVDKLMTLAKYEGISAEDLEGLDPYTPEHKFLICDDMLI